MIIGVELWRIAQGGRQIGERGGRPPVWPFAQARPASRRSAGGSASLLLQTSARVSVSRQEIALTGCGSARSPAIFTIGKMTTSHQFHVRSNHVGVVRWPVSFVAAGVVAVVCMVVASGSVGSSGETAVVDLEVGLAEVDALSAIEPVSALLDGRAFATAVEAGMSRIQPLSILLDGAAFEQAVNEAVASVTNGAALLHGIGFADAVAKAVAVATA